MSPDIVKAEIYEEYKILITFSNKEKKIFDMDSYLKYPIFKQLNNKDDFKKFSIVDGTIEWECGASLSNDTFYLASELIENNLLEM